MGHQKKQQKKNCKNLNPLLKLTSGCESTNDNHIKVWINEEKEQLTDNDIVDPVSHTSDVMEPYIFCGLERDLKMLSTA
jgi:hypothetical protein